MSRSLEYSSHKGIIPSEQAKSLRSEEWANWTAFYRAQFASSAPLLAVQEIEIKRIR